MFKLIKFFKEFFTSITEKQIIPLGGHTCLIETSQPEEYILVYHSEQVVIVDKVYSYEVTHEAGIGYQIWESDDTRYKIPMDKIEFTHYTNIKFEYGE